MELQEFLDRMNAGETVIGGSDAHLVMHALSQEAVQITMELNNAYHTPSAESSTMCAFSRRLSATSATA